MQAISRGQIILISTSLCLLQGAFFGSHNEIAQIVWHIVAAPIVSMYTVYNWAYATIVTRTDLFYLFIYLLMLYSTSAEGL